MKYIYLLTLLASISCSNVTSNTDELLVESLENQNRRNSNWLWIELNSGTKKWVMADELDTTNISGTLTRFYDNGQFFSQTFMSNGIEDSLKMFDTLGRVISTSWHTERGWLFVEYNECGPFIWYHQNLEVYKTGNIINVEGNKRGNREFLNGKIITFFENGDTNKTEFYIDWGFKDGNFKTWYPNGQLDTEENFWIQSRVGSFKKYSEDGKLLKEGKFGFMSGIETEYYFDGTIKSTIHYYQYSKYGPAKYYDSSGNLIKSCTYHNDTLVD